MSIEEKIVQLTKEEFFVELFKYDADLKLTQQFYDLRSVYKSLNLKVDYFLELRNEGTAYFSIKPRLKNKIGYKLGGKNYE